MKKQHWSFAIVVLACLAGLPRLAQAEEAGSVPNIEGKWTGKFKLMHWTGPAEQSLELRVFKQDGPLIKGEKTWHIAPGGSAGNVGGKKRMNATESLVGVIGFDNGLYLAEQGDNGIYTGRITGPDTLELIYIEAGDLATAYGAELKRAK